MKFFVAIMIAVFSSASLANCYIADDAQTESKYRFVLSAKVPSPYVKYMSQAAISKLDSAVKNCLSEVDMPFEMGDGYYGVRSLKTYVVYYPNTTKIAGFIEQYTLSYTEGDDAWAEVRYNSKGQRITPTVR